MQIKRLTVTLGTETLLDIGFRIRHSLALVGQSGSGKSLTLKALLGMLPSSMQMALEVESSFGLVRGESIGFVPQNPFTALSPLTKIKDQFLVGKETVRTLFEKVGLEESLLERFPPELSGGQLQRVVIAIALSSRPRLLMLDEPTTALDPHTREVIIALLKTLQEEMGFLMLFVTHDMVSARALCKEICVIKSGEVQEAGDMESVMRAPKSDYTDVLIKANFANRNFRQ
jgi:ABC-type glutathione transport system ATPase component